MTIDEAIEHAREKAEELKNEAINCQKDSCRRCETDCIECAEEHKQLAEWLEELKELRKCVKSSAFNDGVEKGRADAIREVFAKIGQPNECLFDYTSACCYSISDCMNCPITIDEMKGAEE